MKMQRASVPIVVRNLRNQILHLTELVIELWVFRY
jgi:hypothetical protein